MPTLLQPQPTDPTARLWARIAALEDRIQALERSGVVVPMVTGMPTSGRPGGLAGDTANKIWLNVNGVWKSVPVT